MPRSRSYLAGFPRAPVGAVAGEVVRLEIDAGGGSGVGSVVGEDDGLAVLEERELAGVEHRLPLLAVRLRGPQRAFRAARAGSDD